MDIRRTYTLDLEPERQLELRKRQYLQLKMEKMMKIRNNLDWDAYRYFMTVVDQGSLSAASRHLRVSQPTVGRKLRDLEIKFGVRLFERQMHGYVLTSAGESIVALCRDMAARAIDIERTMAGQDQSMNGQVRIATAEGLGTYWLAPKLSTLKHSHPSIDIQLMIGTSFVDLMRHEADVALRIGSPGCEDLVGRKVGSVSFGIYGANAYLERHDEPLELANLQDHIIIESSGSIAELPQASRLRELSRGATVGLHCDNLSMQISAARAGLGLMAMPHYAAKMMPDLKHVLANVFDVTLDLWLLTHRDLKAKARIRTVLDFLTKEIGRDLARPRTSASLRAT